MVHPDPFLNLIIIMRMFHYACSKNVACIGVTRSYMHHVLYARSNNSGVNSPIWPSIIFSQVPTKAINPSVPYEYGSNSPTGG